MLGTHHCSCRCGAVSFEVELDLTQTTFVKGIQ